MTNQTFSREQKLAAIEREIIMRRRVYPRRVQDGRMTQAEADRELAIMKDIARDCAAQGDLFEKGNGGQ
ncbi:hypothetical protein [Maritimibacter sp. DP1N21-5]|uniref:hypothetical protein n=1 Tax=Maritimibacter sp. DP1N21-5 TaxID=2836867 RepID=UPI001C445D30|nr:hypothetical protein [Maritimibacter sp. DP1N21-5]MBV7408721.1 hypothetical protein [Maritimibacter sp. DP1N21-5]